MSEWQYDVAIVGGSFSGMAAALQLGRSNRSVIVVDDGSPANKSVEKSQGFLFGDGESPAVLSGRARAALQYYQSIHWRNGTVLSVEGGIGDFSLTGSYDGTPVRARRIILACGPVLILPNIAGLAATWGKTAFACGYCHGFEHNRERLALLRTKGTPLYEALLFREWGSVHLLGNGQEPTEQEAAVLKRGRVIIERRPIARVSSPCTVVYEDGQYDDFGALFLTPRYNLPSIVRSVGCAIAKTAVGESLKIDEKGQTSIDGVYGCGMVTNSGFMIADAVASGGQVGRAVHASLYFKTVRAQ